MKMLDRIRESLPFVRRSEYEEVVEKLETLLCSATGGRFSKSGYSIRDMEIMVSDYEQELIDDAVEEATSNLQGEISRLEDELFSLKKRR